MKKKILFIFLFVSKAFFTFSQTQNSHILVRTESNGVQVYESVGNESLSEISFTNIPVKTLSEWNLEECENALYYIGLKIEETIVFGANEFEFQEYEAQKILIYERINSLSLNN